MRFLLIATRKVDFPHLRAKYKYFILLVEIQHWVHAYNIRMQLPNRCAGVFLLFLHYFRGSVGFAVLVVYIGMVFYVVALFHQFVVAATHKA